MLEFDCYSVQGLFDNDLTVEWSMAIEDGGWDEI
jgi:hypothetical protein